MDEALNTISGHHTHYLYELRSTGRNDFGTLVRSEAESAIGSIREELAKLRADLKEAKGRIEILRDAQETKPEPEPEPHLGSREPYGE